MDQPVGPTGWSNWLAYGLWMETSQRQVLLIEAYSN